MFRIGFGIRTALRACFIGIGLMMLGTCTVFLAASSLIDHDWVRIPFFAALILSILGGWLGFPEVLSNWKSGWVRWAYLVAILISPLLLLGSRTFSYVPGTNLLHLWFNLFIVSVFFAGPFGGGICMIILGLRSDKSSRTKALVQT